MKLRKKKNKYRENIAKNKFTLVKGARGKNDKGHTLYIHFQFKETCHNIVSCNKKMKKVLCIL